MNKYQIALNNISKGGKFIEEHKKDIDILQELIDMFIKEIEYRDRIEKEVKNVL